MLTVPNWRRPPHSCFRFHPYSILVYFAGPRQYDFPTLFIICGARPSQPQATRFVAQRSVATKSVRMRFSVPGFRYPARGSIAMIDRWVGRRNHIFVWFFEHQHMPAGCPDDKFPSHATSASNGPQFVATTLKGIRALLQSIPTDLATGDGRNTVATLSPAPRTILYHEEPSLLSALGLPHLTVVDHVATAFLGEMIVR